MARQVPADVPRDGSAPQVIAAARSETDDHLHRLDGRRLGARERGHDDQRDQNRGELS